MIDKIKLMLHPLFVKGQMSLSIHERISEGFLGSREIYLAQNPMYAIKIGLSGKVLRRVNNNYTPYLTQVAYETIRPEIIREWDRIINIKGKAFTFEEFDTYCNNFYAAIRDNSSIYKVVSLEQYTY